MAVTYGQYIQTFLRVDEDAKGLYVEVPGYANDWFKVRCEENDVCPQVTHCRCSHFQHKGTCEHAQAAQAFWNKIYKTNIEKHQESIEVASIEAAMDRAEAQEEAYELAAIDEQISTTESVRHFESKKSAPQIAAPKMSSIEIAAIKRSRNVPKNQGFSILKRVA